MNEVLASLMLWIGANTAYPTDGVPLPAVVPMTPAALTAEYYKDVPHLVPADGVDERVLALYAFEDGPHGTIYVLGCRPDESLEDEEPACDDPVYRERLLHELVHHVQYVSGAYTRFPCRAFGERDAYLLGGRFLKSHHATDPLPNRNFWAHIYSRC